MKKLIVVLIVSTLFLSCSSTTNNLGVSSKSVIIERAMPSTITVSGDLDISIITENNESGRWTTNTPKWWIGIYENKTCNGTPINGWEKTVVDEDGKWAVVLPAKEVFRDLFLEVHSDEELHRSNIATHSIGNNDYDFGHITITFDTFIISGTITAKINDILQTDTLGPIMLYTDSNDPWNTRIGSTLPENGSWSMRVEKRASSVVAKFLARNKPDRIDLFDLNPITVFNTNVAGVNIEANFTK